MEPRLRSTNADAFGGLNSVHRNIDPSWIGSGLAASSAAVTFLFVRHLTTDGIAKEVQIFRAYLEVNGYDTSQIGLRSEASTFADDTGSTHCEKGRA